MIDGWTGALATAAAVRAGEVSAVEVAEAALTRIAAQDGRFNAFTDVLPERARADAAAVDRARARGDELPALASVPYAVKNLFDLAGLVTRAGARIERDKAPAPADAFLVQRLHRAGGVCTGALNMDEYAYGFVTENAHDGNTRNPHDLDRSAGGSSGGSAAAVAGGLVPLSLGTDTNGSIRVPASLCGIFGLKPTYGRLSRHGAFPFVASLDHVGPFARELPDLAAAYDQLQGLDAADPAQAARDAEPVTPGLGIGPADLRVAIAGGHFQRHGLPEAQAPVDMTARALGVTRTVDVPDAEIARAAAFLITAAEGGELHRANLRVRAQDFDPATRDRLLAGCLVPAQWVLRAQRFRARFRAAMLALFGELDVLIAPATPCTAPMLGQATIDIGGRSLPVRPFLGVYTQPISFIGLPVLTVPIPLGGGLPMGVQLIAAPWREAALFQVADVLVRAGLARAPRPSV